MIRLGAVPDRGRLMDPGRNLQQATGDDATARQASQWNDLSTLVVSGIQLPRLFHPVQIANG
jgi:hypothetical protein